MPTPVPKILPRRKRQPLTRSQVMARIRSENTRPEILTRSAVHALGIRFRKHVSSLPGKPDLSNMKRKWAIFVHGCFWHAHEGCKLAFRPQVQQSVLDQQAEGEPGARQPQDCYTSYTGLWRSRGLGMRCPQWTTAAARVAPILSGSVPIGGFPTGGRVKCTSLSLK
jgi:DNA mismatch endonuclease Vsr